LLGYGVDRVVGFLAAAHEDSEAHAVGRVDRVVFVVDEQQFVTPARRRSG
jgi:hypothetical protein